MPIPTIHIKLDGVEMPPHYAVLSVDTCTEVNKVPWAEVILLDGNAAKRKFPASEKGDFDLGKPIEIGISYLEKPGSLGTVFTGFITKQTVEMDSRGQKLRIECRHPAFLMTRIRRSTSFPPGTDAKMLATLMESYKGQVSASMAGLSGPEHQSLVQFHATDWDFMLSRCEANGWLVIPTGGDLKIIDKPVIAPDSKPANQMDFNANEVFGLELTLDGESQYAYTEATAYDPKTQATSKAAKAKGNKLSPGKIDPEKVPHVVTGIGERLWNGTVMAPEELTAWSNSVAMRGRLSFLRGRFEVRGNAKLLPGQTCTINGIGSRYDGPAFASAIRQRITVDGWTTDVQLGLSDTPFHQNLPTCDLPAAGLLPGVNGLQIGVIQDFKEDAGGQFRVQVYLPAMEKAQSLIWARYMTPEAGKGKGETARGMLFWPEKGDEVVLGFLNDDPRAGIVLGSLFNSKYKPLYPQSAENPKKGWLSKSGFKLEFDDKEQAAELSGPNISLILNEKDGVCTLTEKTGGAVLSLGKEKISLQFKGNSLVIDANGITLDSKGKLGLAAKKGATLAGGTAVEITGSKIELK